MGLKGFLSKCVLGVGLTGLMFGSVLATEQSSDQKQIMMRQQGTQMSQERMGSQQSLAVVRTSKLIGHTIKDAQGEDLGTVYDLVLTPDYQDVCYIALSTGGVMGIGAKRYAVSWSAMRQGAGDTCILDITKQQLSSTEPFKSDEWLAEANPKLFPMRPGQMQSSGTQGAMTSGQESKKTSSREMAMENRNVQARRVTVLTGMEVENGEGKDIGNVEGFVATLGGTAWQMNEQQSDQQQSSEAATQMQAGRLVYTVVSLGGFFGFGEKYALVPAKAVTFQPQRSYARLDTTEENLKAIAFKPSDWPDLSSRAYAKQIYDRFDEQPYWVTLGYMAPAQEQEAASRNAWAPNSEYNQRFDAQTIKTIEGTVENVGTFEPASGVREGLRLRIKTDDGKMFTVNAGPRWYAEQQNFSVKSGDKIKVTGSQVTIAGRSVILSTKIENGNETLDLRSNSGEPKWKMSERPQSQRQQM
jgi:sporulation protein YlmC with PRC-barrel domain